MLGNVLWSWLFSIFPHGCCMIIAPTRRRVSHTLTVMCMRVSSGTDIHSRNSSGSIVFGQEWMPRLRAWAAAIISTFPPSDRIGTGSIALHVTLVPQLATAICRRCFLRV